MGEIFGMAGQIAAASMQASAIKAATQMQIDALERQQKFVYSELEPGKINAQALAADIDRAKSRLALQGITDPDLLKARYVAEQKMLEGVSELGTGTSEQVAQQAAAEALAGGGVAEQMKQKLIDSALDEMNAGASLPPDVQAELVKAGFERSGAVSGAATTKGIGGNISREMIGERALALKTERQGKAIAMTQAASALEQNRASLLQSLFPALKTNQLQNLAAAQGTMAAGAAEIPEAGLSGESVANIWLARVGATNQLAQSSADAAARSAMGQAQAWSQGIGGATKYSSGQSSIPSTAQTWSSLFGSSGTPSSSGGDNSTAAMALMW